MNQRTALIAAAAITAFVLVLVGGLAAAGVQLSQSPSNAQTAPSPSPAAQSSMEEREALYRQQLQQAEAQLREANSRLSKAYGESSASNTEGAQPGAAAQGTTAPAQQATDSISPGEAALIGAAAAPGAALLSGPELVDFEGTRAYELQFDRGAVYIDASTGRVLDNGTTWTARTPLFTHLGENDDDHEEYDDD